MIFDDSASFRYRFDLINQTGWKSRDKRVIESKSFGHESFSYKENQIFSNKEEFQ